MCNLVELPSLSQWQDFHTFHVEPDILFPGNTTESIHAITKSTSTINIKFTMLI